LGVVGSGTALSAGAVAAGVAGVADVVDAGLGAGTSGPLTPQAVVLVHSIAAMSHRTAARIAKCRNIGSQSYQMTTDSAFISAADATLIAIGAALDAALEASDVDLDWSLNDGILEIECEDGSKLIVNRHVPNREIWVAAKSGGFHFRPTDGAWRDSRTGEELAVSLARIFREQAGLTAELPALAAPR
jgi:CyaY protein